MLDADARRVVRYRQTRRRVVGDAVLQRTRFVRMESRSVDHCKRGMLPERQCRLVPGLSRMAADGVRLERGR